MHADTPINLETEQYMYAMRSLSGRTFWLRRNDKRASRSYQLTVDRSVSCPTNGASIKLRISTGCINCGTFSLAVAHVILQQINFELDNRPTAKRLHAC